MMMMTRSSQRGLGAQEEEKGTETSEDAVDINNSEIEGAARSELRVTSEVSEMEIQLRLREIELAEKKLDSEERRFQMELELRREIELSKLGIEEKRIEAERDISVNRGLNPLGASSGTASNGEREMLNGDEIRLKKWSCVLKAIAPSVPENNADLPMFFRGVENIFDNQEVPEEYRAKLIMPVLGDKMRNRVSRLGPEQLDDYSVIKGSILEEYMLSPKVF